MHVCLLGSARLQFHNLLEELKYRKSFEDEG